MLKLTRTLTIDRLGAQGDGIAHDTDGDVFIPNTLPGEQVAITQDGARGEVIDILKPSRMRQQPACPFYGHCGGCLLQHATPAFYAEWKQTVLSDTLRQANLSIKPEPMIAAHGEGRRRVTLHARRINGEWQVGFMARRSHTLVALTHCMLLVPALENATAIAQTLVEALGGDKPLDVQLTATESGIDVDIRGHGPISDGKRRVLAKTAQHLGLARLSLHHDMIVEQTSPQVTMGNAVLIPPPGGFLQATRSGEETLGALVVDAAHRGKQIADLFAGVGTFSLRLAHHAPVHAVESDPDALASLDHAARNTTHLKPISVECRDLFKRPLQPLELNRFDTVVFDPPRAGAEAQVRQLARSEVRTVIAVSCNAGTFARDAKILIDGGYALEKLWPVDQFLYSAHIELVAVFTKTKSTKKQRRLFG
jgi:23S rRNA (uracil1939-C5)-methyltransferase